MTIQSDFETLIDELETNLQAMGVYDAEFDATTGIRGLVARIVDINPSLTGVALTTAVSCSSSHQTVVMGDTITISGVLTATYDDRSVTNVDLSGYLQGATINIYNGQTLLGTAITDSNGAYTFSYTTNAITNLSILAQFDGTDDYSSCSSSNVAVSVIGEITVTSNKNILSAADHETATLTAHLTDTVIENVSINFYKEGNNMAKTLIGTATTDANGVATITYTATGAGDITIQAESESNGSLVTETYSVEDCLYARVTEWSYTKLNTTENVTKLDTDLSLTLPNSFTMEWDYKGNISGGRFGVYPTSNLSNRYYSLSVQIDTNDYDGIYRDTSTHGMDSGRLTTDNTQYNSCKISYTSTSATWLLGGTNSATANISFINNHNPYTIGLWAWKTGTIYVKNLKIKPL